MSFTLVAYEKLKNHIEEAIKTLVSHHKKETVGEIPDERRIQAQVLLKTIELCDKIKVSTDDERNDQATILNAAVYYIHLQIENSYKGSYLTKPTNSNFYNSLTTSLDLSVNNTPSLIERRNLFAALDLFQREHMYKDGDAAKGVLSTQVFDIKGYSIKDDNLALTEIHHQLVLKIDKDAWALHEKSQTKSKGGQSSFFGSGATIDEQKTNAPEAKKSAHL